MSKLVKKEFVRLFVVSETRNEAGLYDLEPFGGDEHYHVFERGHLREELNGAVNYLFGGGNCYKVSDVNYIDDEEECISVSVNETAELLVPTILEQVDADSNKLTYYVMVNPEFTEYRWVVLEQLNTCFQG